MKKLLLFLMFLSFFAFAKAQKGINLIENAENGYKKESLGDSVNSTATELLPLISADGKTLLFCRNGHPENNSGGDEDIWQSTWNEEGKYWEKAVNLGAPLNNEGNNSAFAFSPDGNTIFVMGEYYPNGVHKGGGISISGKDMKGWFIPSKMTVEDYYNDSHFGNYCLSSGQNVMIMSLGRKESSGGNDLWVCFKKDGDNWSRPLNMGKMVNTPEHEASPFLAADNKTLYFATTGLKGYGNFDLFVTKRLDDTWTNWSEPKNLGPEINTKKLDAFYTISAKGDYAYMVSEENSLGGTDIFRIKLPEAAKPDPVVLVFGKVSYTDGTPIEADITYKEIDAVNSGLASSSPTDGNYKVVLATGKKFEITFSGKEIVTKTESLDLTSYTEYTEIERNYIVERLKKTTSVTTTETSENSDASGNITKKTTVTTTETFKPTNIYFDYNISDLDDKAKTELDKLVAELLKNKELKLNLTGHTDSKGENEFNKGLGERRVESTKQYLKSKGVAADRITVVSLGEEKPVKSNDSDKGRAMNRRVEVSLK